MNSNLNRNPFSNPITILISILIIITGIFGLLFWREMTILNNAYADMNRIEFLSSTTQRLIGLAHSEHEHIIQKDVFFIDESTTNALTHGSDVSLSVLDEVAMVVLANEVLQSWVKIEELLSAEVLNTIDLSLARDGHYKAMTNLSNGISEYTKELNNNISTYQIIVMVMICIIALVMLSNLLRTHEELKISKQLADTAQIDTATGLYNRSRCQELFKNKANLQNKKNPAVIVIDLNDLKKTNDSLGHRVGDELISSFAEILKLSVNVHTVKPFVGRYGGDEFVVYYDDIANEDDLKMYLDELKFQAEYFNNNEQRFQIAYAAGYSFAESLEEELIANSDPDADKGVNVRKLFDRADENMYNNKIAGKRAKDPDYDEKVSQGQDTR